MKQNVEDPAALWRAVSCASDSCWAVSNSFWFAVNLSIMLAHLGMKWQREDRIQHRAGLPSRSRPGILHEQLQQQPAVARLVGRQLQVHRRNSIAQQVRKRGRRQS